MFPPICAINRPTVPLSGTRPSASPPRVFILPVLITEGYFKRGVPLWRLGQVSSTNTARKFLLTQKGEIKPGFDADFAIVDLDWEREITPDLYGCSDYSIYAGMKFEGWPRYTVSRGEIIQKDGTVPVEPGRGKYIKRSSTRSGHDMKFNIVSIQSGPCERGESYESYMGRQLDLFKKAVQEKAPYLVLFPEMMTGEHSDLSRTNAGFPKLRILTTVQRQR